MSKPLNSLQVEKAKNKTFIGKTEKGFDWLGYHIFFSTAHTEPQNGSPVKLTMANTTVTNHIEKLCRLYEQGLSNERVTRYMLRWWMWAKGGVMSTICFFENETVVNFIPPFLGNKVHCE